MIFERDSSYIDNDLIAKATAPMCGMAQVFASPFGVRNQFSDTEHDAKALLFLMIARLGRKQFDLWIRNLEYHAKRQSIRVNLLLDKDLHKWILNLFYDWVNSHKTKTKFSLIKYRSMGAYFLRSYPNIYIPIPFPVGHYYSQYAVNVVGALRRPGETIIGIRLENDQIIEHVTSPIKEVGESQLQWLSYSRLVGGKNIGIQCQDCPFKSACDLIDKQHIIVVDSSFAGFNISALRDFLYTGVTKNT